jgi:hypothetical protein
VDTQIEKEEKIGNNCIYDPTSLLTRCVVRMVLPEYLLVRLFCRPTCFGGVCQQGDQSIQASYMDLMQSSNANFRDPACTLTRRDRAHVHVVVVGRRGGRVQLVDQEGEPDEQGDEAQAPPVSSP